MSNRLYNLQIHSIKTKEQLELILEILYSKGYGWRNSFTGSAFLRGGGSMYVCVYNNTYILRGGGRLQLTECTKNYSFEQYFAMNTSELGKAIYGE